MQLPTPEPLKEESVDQLKCSLCLLPRMINISTLVTIDGYSEQYVLSMEDNAGKAFHSQCMEFWVKAVNRDLAAIPTAT